MSKTDNPFSNVTTLYENRDALQIDYQPETVVERDSEINKLAQALSPVQNGWRPDNIMIYGKTGVGKTVVTKYMLSQLSEHAEFASVRVTCSSNSSYRTAINIVNKLRDDTERDALPRTGLPTDTVFDALYDELNSRGTPAILVLDEIDNLGDDDKLLYNLPRAQDNDHLNEDTTVGIIGISNDFTFRDNLSPKVKDSLAEKEIHFKPYGADELRTILSKRADVAVRDSVLEDDVIPLCAALASQEHGSARQAIELLRESVDLATERELTTFGEGVVRDARDRVEKNQISDAMGSITDHALLAFIAVSYETEIESGGVRTKTIHSRYKALADMNEKDPLVYDRLRDQLNELELYGFVTKTNVNEGRKEGGGRYHLYESNYDYETVTDVLDDREEHWKVFDLGSSQTPLGHYQ